MTWTWVQRGANRMAWLAIALLVHVQAADLPGGASRTPDGHVLAARSLLRGGRLGEARKEAGLAASTADGSVLLGEICYREADFDAAGRHFSRALALDGASARAYLGLGRLDELNFRPQAARWNFSKAYALAPNDPEIVLACASAAATRREEAALLGKYLRVSAGEPRRDLESALARLELYRHIGDRKLAAPEGPYSRYDLRMAPWFPAGGRPTGLLLKVSINDSKPLRLVFDTGARGMYISQRSARKLSLEYISESGVSGLGGTGWGSGRKMLARTVRIDDLVLHDCLADVTDEPLAAGADGVIGADFLAGFLIRLDAQQRVLSLVPYADGLPEGERDRTVPAGMEDFLRLCRLDHLLLLKAGLKGESASGYFVIDTGAAYSSLSDNLAAVRGAPMEIIDLSLSGAGGQMRSARRAGLVRFRFGAATDLIDTDVLALDLRPLSDRHGVEISGLIGYPALSRSPVTINYRDGLIGFGR